MNENIDLTKILEGCPVGTGFYHLVFGKVVFCFIDNSVHPIKVKPIDRRCPTPTSITKDGKMWEEFDGDCLLVPSKDQRDWSKFERFWDKPRVARFDLNTLQPFDKVLMRNYDGCVWEPSFFGYKTDEDLICIAALNVRCIPYNEETKHLLGTKDDCPEYYKWWEE